ncbi:N-acetyl-1-D-myo-inositol-2-amino-2-deoxy-alpha-D-glucopyranoside deacetylase [Planotetraspora sp. A-T 1434]|uniref:N-acetyl-1-D-myo-inositol-2-amino-2-deoxy-alpha- D-glucopyranoside deacetylase n=1 Tax=Planotetraspora sp. A-T 1434 TaxID=2979219 RepID=UPI0021BE5249|nr:N-acetyl-1-D-myo-inositol-2-amino-2-deoxy-alpha-D-glucopyranoside deacetylase [Planotetraspora sp. A-T 1434]MCT9932636.1 N-acetyl-1-D-myo-inositol-2-amino-2-deoxy-alpha-D-glucopyranoside deacetylase [Planotetraspora sp. A-T 1434]
MTDRRLLLVHAHPDDESIGTGATMAKYVAEGAHVTLVTCTLGEEGEVIPAELAHLAADRDDTLGQYRIGELAAACRALGVTDHRFLGGAGRWRDSGMMGAVTNDRPGCFWRADLDEAAGELVKVIREVRPQVLVTYDENGFYGHPDHIQAHRVAWRAFELAADPAHPGGEPWRIAKFYLTALPKSVMRRATEAMRQADVEFWAPEPVDDLPFGCSDEAVTTEIDARAHVEAKIEAMRAHVTQIAVDAPWFALSNNVGQQVLGVEHFILRAGVPGRPGIGAPYEAGGIGEPYNRESDLFAGVG